MSDESALRQKVRDAIQAGKLPDRRPARTWGGRGCGAVCTICGEPVKHEDVEFELEFAGADDMPGSGNHHVHLRCFTAWEFESQDFELTRRPIASSPVATVGSRALPGRNDGGTIAACDCDPTYKRGPA